MTTTISVMAHERNFFGLKKVLGPFIREIDYPTKLDPSYLIRAEVPTSDLNNLRGIIRSLQQK